MSTNLTQKQLLMERINSLEIKQAIELRQLKSQVHHSVQSFNPLAIISASFSGDYNTPEVKSDLLNTAVHLTSQLLFKNTILGRFQTPIKRVLGNLLQSFIK